MVKKILIRFLGIFFICIFLSSCARIAAKDRSSRDIKGALRQRAVFYQNKDKGKFFEHISGQYYPNYKEFQYEVEDFLYNHSSIQLDFNIEKILASGNSRSVDVKWFKTYVDKQGNPVKRTGSAVLIFDVSGNKLLLVNIKGDNPFTQ